MPPLTVVVVQIGPGLWAPLCSQHGPSNTWVGSPMLAAFMCMGHVAAFHTTRRTPQETR